MNADEQPNSYMLHWIGAVLAIVGVQTTRVRLDGPQVAAEKIAAGQVAFVAAADLQKTGAAIVEHLNAAALAAAADQTSAGGFAEEPAA